MIALTRSTLPESRHLQADYRKRCLGRATVPRGAQQINVGDAGIEVLNVRAAHPVPKTSRTHSRGGDRDRTNIGTETRQFLGAQPGRECVSWNQRWISLRHPLEANVSGS